MFNKADRFERRENIRFLRDLVRVLNRIKTSVVKEENKYIVSHKGIKKYEVEITHSDAVIREFNGDVPGRVRVIAKEGLTAKYELASLKLRLETKIRKNSLKQIANKLKTFRADIRLANYVLTVLYLPETQVSVINETPLMKKYEITYKHKGQTKVKTIEFVGKLVKIDEDQCFEKTGYMALKWDLVRRGLDKCIKKQNSMSFFDRLRSKFNGRDRNRQH